MDAEEVARIVELGLLCSAGPCAERKLLTLFDAQEKIGTKEIAVAIEAVSQQWADKGLEVIKTASGWQVRSKAGYKERLQRFLAVTPPRLSRPMYIVLAIVAYSQPVTRGDIEEIRGVTTSANQLATLEEMGWVEVTGRRETPGRPLLYGTTKKLLNDLGLTSLSELPPLEEYGDNLAIKDSAAVNGEHVTDNVSPAD